MNRGHREPDGEGREGDGLSPEESALLTGIHGTYTLASPHEPEFSEVDSAMVKHFIDTLAEVALAVASREWETGG